MNALNTGWDLYLNKPYKQHGKADNSWEIPGLKTAVAVQGTLNNSNDKDHGWTIEIAYPWSAFTSRQEVKQPQVGTEWRINFSRVEWKIGQKKKTTGSGHPGSDQHARAGTLGLPALPRRSIIQQR